MGVIRKGNNTNNPYGPCIEDILEGIVDETFGIYQQEETHRRPRKIKHRSAKIHAVGGVNVSSTKSGKKKKRIDNSNFLLSLADPEEAQELSIHDFIPHTISAFSQFLKDAESMEIWNTFINCTENNEWFHNDSADQNHLSEQQEGKFTCDMEANGDNRSKHPAYSAAQCFQKIDNGLRYMLRKKHVPLGTLMHLEDDLVTFFVNRPQSIYQSEFPSSYERLLVHALSQYMDLSSLSYNRNGSRWTRIRNVHSNFQPPTILLSNFLERKVQKRNV